MVSCYQRGGGRFAPGSVRQQGSVPGAPSPGHGVGHRPRRGGARHDAGRLRVAGWTQPAGHRQTHRRAIRFGLLQSAVRAAVEEERLDEARLRSYHKLEREQQHIARKHDQALNLQEKRKWKLIQKANRQRQRVRGR